MMRIAIVGAGAVGQVIGAKLIGAGHEVTLLARQGSAERLRAAGLRLADRRGRDELERPARVLETPAELAGIRYDALFVAVRADQLAPTLAALRAAGVEGEQLVLCTPIWGPDPAYALAGCKEQLVLVPGMLAGDDGSGVIRYRLVTTRLGPLEGPVGTGVRALALALVEAGLPTEVEPDLGRGYVAQLAVLLPWALAIERTGFDLGALRRDRAIRATAAQASQEAVALAAERSGGVSPWTRFAARASSPLMTLVALFLAPLTRRGWGKVAWKHVQKIAAQDRQMLAELYRWAEARGSAAPALSALLSG
jgi:2-dehydropantoate 2-reductase